MQLIFQECTGSIRLLSYSAFEMKEPWKRPLISKLALNDEVLCTPTYHFHNFPRLFDKSRYSFEPKPSFEISLAAESFLDFLLVDCISGSGLQLYSC